jgi:phage tail-like protein
MRRSLPALAILVALISVGAVGVAVAAPAPPLEKLSSYAVVLEVDGLEIGTFQEVSGLAIEVEVVEVREGGDNSFTRKLPGRVKYPNIVLKQGFASSPYLYDWIRQIAGGQTIKRPGRVLVHDSKGALAATFSFTGAFPVKWAGPDFDASSGRPALETLELAHEGFLN